MCLLYKQFEDKAELLRVIKIKNNLNVYLEELTFLIWEIKAKKNLLEISKLFCIFLYTIFNFQCFIGFVLIDAF